jgi:hypothetical protein
VPMGAATTETLIDEPACAYLFANGVHPAPLHTRSVGRE